MGRARGRPQAGPGLPGVGGVVDPAVRPARSVTERSAEAASRGAWSGVRASAGPQGGPETSPSRSESDPAASVPQRDNVVADCVSLASPCGQSSFSPSLLLSKSNPLRWASIRFGTADRDHPHTASVLTWLKIEERQTFAVRSLYAPKRLCPKGFRLLQAVAPLEISLEIRRKQTDLPRSGLRPSERLMISWRI